MGGTGTDTCTLGDTGTVRVAVRVGSVQRRIRRLQWLGTRRVPAGSSKQRVQLNAPLVQQMYHFVIQTYHFVVQTYLSCNTKLRLSRQNVVKITTFAAKKRQNYYFRAKPIVKNYYFRTKK